MKANPKMRPSRLRSIVADAKCTIDIVRCGLGVDITIEAGSGMVFSGTGTHVLVTRSYSHLGEAYAEAARDLRDSLPLESCDAENCEWCSSRGVDAAVARIDRRPRQ